jgi:hypothetical protein
VTPSGNITSHMTRAPLLRDVSGHGQMHAVRPGITNAIVVNATRHFGETPRRHPSINQMGVDMAEYTDEFSLRRLKSDEEGPQEYGVVVCLQAHRRWRSQRSSDHCGDIADEIDPLGAQSWHSVQSATEEIVLIREPSLWLAGSVALISFALIIGLYWAFTTAIVRLLDFSFFHF